MRCNTTLILLPIFSLAIWLGGLAGVSAAQEEQKEQLTQRVNEYWGYKINRHFEKSYLYESPEYRQKVPLSTYQQSFGAGIKWLSAEVEKVAVEAPDRATVRMKIRYKWTMAKAGPKDGFTGALTENWRRVDDSWYHERTESKKGFMSRLKKKEEKKEAYTNNYDFERR